MTGAGYLQTQAERPKRRSPPAGTGGLLAHVSRGRSAIELSYVSKLNDA